MVATLLSLPELFGPGVDTGHKVIRPRHPNPFDTAFYKGSAFGDWPFGDGKLATFSPLNPHSDLKRDALVRCGEQSCEVMAECQGWWQCRPRARQTKHEHVGRGRTWTGLTGRRRKDGGHLAVSGRWNVALLPEGFQAPVACRAPALGSAVSPPPPSFLELA